MSGICSCQGCGRSNCGVYGGRFICENPLRRRGWAFHSGVCTSCVCGSCGAHGQPCPPFCTTRPNARQFQAASMHPSATTLPPPPPPYTPPMYTHPPPPPPVGPYYQPMQESLHPTAASSHQPQPQTEIQQPAHGQQQHIGHQVETAQWSVFDCRVMREIACSSQCRVKQPRKH